MPGTGLDDVTTCRDGTEHGGDTNVAAALEAAPRSLLAATIVDGESSSRLFRLDLGSAFLTSRGTRSPAPEAVAAAHRPPGTTRSKNEAPGSTASWPSAASTGNSDPDQELLGPYAGSQAVAQLLVSQPQERAAAFAFSTYPAAACGKLPIGAEGTNDLGKVATPILSVDGTINWQERLSKSDTAHPEMERFAEVIRKLTGGRAERARQFFDWCVVAEVVVPDPAGLERELNNCVKLIGMERAAC